MAQDGYKKPLPTPSPESKRYWDGCRNHELWLPFCRNCEAFYFYPRDFCPTCFGWDIEWRKASGRGRIHTFAIQHRAYHPAWQDEIPYVTALVELDEGPRLYSNIIGIDPDPTKIHCDMQVEVTFEDITEEITLPRFKPSNQAN